MMNSPCTVPELDAALATLQLEKSPGPDKITNEMLLHLGPAAKKKLLQLIDDSWKTRSVPQIWKEAVMVPVHRKGKDKTTAYSHRPISFTHCMGKLTERPIDTRFMQHLETKQLIKPEQAACRQGRSTEAQITFLTQEIEDVFQEKKHTLAVWTDTEKALDRVWKDGLKLKLRHCGVAGRMYKWIGQYLKNRRARVQIQHHQSRVHELKQGIPQRRGGGGGGWDYHQLSFLYL